MRVKQVAAVLGFMLLGGGATASAGFLDWFGSSAINTVKNGVMEDYSSTMKIGPALENYYDCQKGTTEWSEFETEKGETIVEFKCTLGEEHLHYFDNLKADRSAPNEVRLDAAIAWINLRNMLQELPLTGIDEWQQLGLSVQFAMSQVNDDEFELSYMGVEPTYSNGAQGSIPVTLGTLQGVFADVNLFDADFVNYENVGRGVVDFVSDASSDFLATEYDD